MTVAEILAQAGRQGVDVGLNPTGDGLRIWSEGDPPADLVELLKRAKPQIVATLRGERERHTPLLRKVERSMPTDADNRQWRTAVEGLESFLLSGYGDEAEGLGWPRDELYAVPPLWARVDLCGAALLIGDREVVSITPNEIRIKTASGAIQSFYRKRAVDYGVAYRARIKAAGEDASKEEVQLRAFEAVVNLYRSHHPNADVDIANAAVLAAIKEAAP